MSAVGIGSCSDEAACFDAALSWYRVKADEVQGDVPEHGEVMGGMSGTGAHLIVGEDNIHAPVQAVFDTPVIADCPQEAIGIGGEARKI